MRHWLMKSEPDAFSISDLERQGTAPWDGVRNYQARNNMQAMAVGDRIIFYHSNGNPSGIAGLATVARTAYPDHTSFDPKSDYFDAKSTAEKPRWFMVDVRFASAFPQVVPLEYLRTIPELSDMQLFTHGRLSVIPLSSVHYSLLAKLGSKPPAAATVSNKQRSSRRKN